MISLEVDGRRVTVTPGATLLDAVGTAGLKVPALCHHPRLAARAMCRMCLVEVAGQARPVPACATAASDGDVVVTRSPALDDFRRMNVGWLASHDRHYCPHCEVQGSCSLQPLLGTRSAGDDRQDGSWQAARHHEHRDTDHTSPSIWLDVSKCIDCGLCADACGDGWQHQYVIGFAERGADRRPVTAFDRPLAETGCISCGQCTLVCPVGALIEAPQWHEVERVLASGQRFATVQVAPATRIAIGEEFGLAPGSISTGRLISALRALGFDRVFDTNFGADLTIMEESRELVERLKSAQALPLFTSCCPGWVNWVEINRPDLLAHLSSTKSPQQMHGAITKRSQLGQALVKMNDPTRAEPYVVSVMPCTAKKDEAARPGMTEDVDCALTTRELARMIRHRGIEWERLPDDGVFDGPLGESTGAGQIFAASGGVMEAMIRTVVHLNGSSDTLPLEWESCRGVSDGVKTATVPGVGTVAICNGIAAGQRLLEDSKQWQDFVAIEVMACIGGCLGGGGEPKSEDPQVLRKRAAAVYELDRRAPRRRSHDNPNVRALYARELGEPGSPAARALLHTSYAARRSHRELLMRFLDCVDRRDGGGASRLFHSQGIWSTGSSYGDFRGAEAIAAFIANGLPPRQGGRSLRRHRMERVADIDDLTVLEPTGRRCRFDLEVETFRHQDRDHQLITKLVRLPLV